MSKTTQSTETSIEREALDITGDPILKKMLAEERVESRWLDSALLGRLAAFLKPHKGLSGVAFVMAVLEALMMTLPAYAIGLAIDRVDAPLTKLRLTRFVGRHPK